MVCMLWNQLPEAIVNAPSVDVFKRRLDKILLGLAFSDTRWWSLSGLFPRLWLSADFDFLPIMTFYRLWLSTVLDFLPIMTFYRLWLSTDYDFLPIMTFYRLWLSTDYDFLPIMTFYRLWLSTDHDFLPIMTFYRLWLSTDYDNSSDGWVRLTSTVVSGFFGSHGSDGAGALAYSSSSLDTRGRPFFYSKSRKLFLPT